MVFPDLIKKSTKCKNFCRFKFKHYNRFFRCLYDFLPLMEEEMLAFFVWL